MSFLGALFGGSKTPNVTPTPPPPRIGDSVGEAAAREERYRAKAKYGVEDTMLGSPGSSKSVAAPKPARTMLG